ncbi:hypothetical protein G9A89_014973 [Geosiphon pyriformis]|nr:hypothetical protein G9A89_014973 [Geosiphon pyriformis]
MPVISVLEINQTIEKYTQQQFPITYADKGKGKLQTPAVTPKQIQPPNWKKTQVESPTHLSYHYTPGKNSEFGILNLQTQQNSNLKNPEIKTLNIQPLPNQNNQNSNLINQPDLSSVIIINLPPVEPIGQPLQQPHQQIQQPLVPLQQPPQPNLDLIAYTPIAKLKKFTGKKNNAQVWLNDVGKAIAANGWNDAKAIQAISYFFQNTAKLANTFTTIKQEENKAVTTYLGCFHRNLHHIQAIDPNYFTVAQILNQFIRGLCTTVTNARDFEAAELEANHAQAVNLVINGSSELDSKLKQFKSVMFIIVNQSTVATGNTTISSELPTYDAAATLSTTSILNTNLSTNDTSKLLAIATTHLSATASGNISAPTNSNTTTELISKQNSKAEIDSTKLEIIDGILLHNQQDLNNGIWTLGMPNTQNYLSLLITPKDAQPNNLKANQHPTLTSNILPATIIENELLDAIFPFKLKEPSTTPLFSGATLEEKPITAMYTNAKVDGHSIKLILDSGLAGSIITKQLMDQLGCRVDCTASARIITTNGATKTPIGEIDDFPFEVNGIIIPIKVLVMEATQYQVLVENDWLSKTNAILDWTMQELQLSQNGQHTHVPAMCGHFKTTNLTTSLIKFEEDKEKPTWEAYQVSWADENHNELLLILS